MKWSKSYLYTSKDAPNDAEIPSHKLLIRAGFMKKLAPGIYTYGALGLRAIRKFENIIREELNKISCVEILMPMVQPRELWEETHRWKEMGAGLLKFQNRNENWFCLGATHEEAVTDYVRNDLKSYKDLPRTLYQIQTKYRDEIRPRFGLMRGREFIMKDAYSFDLDQAGALKSYDELYNAYKSIFERLNLNYRIVVADAGNIGGSQTHEFQLLADAGEDALLVSDTTSFAANVEVCPAIDAEEITIDSSVVQLPMEKFSTPGQKTIADLSRFTGMAEKELVKTLFFSANDGSNEKDKNLKPIAVILRGSDELNPIKLKNVLKLTNPPQMLTDDEVKNVTGAWPGSCGPVGLKIPVYMDQGVQNLKNYIVGANEDQFHLKNVNTGRDFNPVGAFDLRMAKEGDRCPENPKGRLKSYRGIEVGHVFYLGKKYSEKMGATFLDAQGKSQFFEMGCYGIGVTRTVQAAIEQSHDADGIIWPESIAPFKFHFCVLDPKDEKLMGFAEDLYKQLNARHLDVFMDDRDERPGVKFKDADLLGMPYRLVLGKKSFDAGELELVDRKTKKQVKIKLTGAFELLAGDLKGLFKD
ncbi:MAG TPA: proline--tRNA ligase [Pseudobdellovibrionaceae bacterium]|nr:proline--tRNA ligase [Pseudobdellovibrionaceae bacterium]